MSHPVLPHISMSKRFYMVRSSVMHAVLDVLADPWQLEILKAVLHKPLRFDEIIALLGISRTALSMRLNLLAEHDCLQREHYGSSGKRFEYQVTAQGRDLAPVFILMDQWNRNWLANATDAGQTCPHCQCQLNVHVVCAHCERPFNRLELKPLFFDESAPLHAETQAYRRTRSTPGSGDSDPAAIRAEAWMRDRWSALIIGCLLFGIYRYADIQECLEIAPNILAQRLDLLTRAGMLQRMDDGGYSLTERGYGLYPMIQMMREWGMKWLPGHSPTRHGWQLLHTPCLSWFRPVVACQNCNGRYTSE